MTKRKAKLSPKERAFVHAYLGRARGNGTTAAILAGYSKATARSKASQLLTKVNIRQAIELRTDAREQTGILTADEADRLLSELARNDLEDTRERIAAIKELNKVSGRHILKHQVEGRITYEQVLGASRVEDSTSS